MIKLQLLLRHPGANPEVDPALRALLDQHGFKVTAEGRASVSATMSEDDFMRLFGPHRPLRAGFAARQSETPELAVPADLQDAISLITIAPRHATIGTSPRGKHAAI